MPRDVDERKKRKALRKLRKAAELAEAGLGPPLSDWEREFLEEVEARIEEYGSAFADSSKGNLEEPLSALQAQKLKEIDKKARGKGQGMSRGGFKRKTPPTRRTSELVEDETEADAPHDETPAAPAPPQTPPPRPPGRPVFRVIDGGKGEKEN